MVSLRISRLVQFLRAYNLVKPLVVSKDPHWHARLSMNGLGLESYDRQRGNPHPHHLMSHGSICRIYALNSPCDERGNTFLDYATLSEKDMTFIASSKLSMSRPMYDISCSKSVFDYKVSLGFVGTSSLALVTETFTPGISEPIFQQSNQVIFVSRETRRPEKLPDWFKEKYSGKGILQKGVFVKPLLKPECTFVYDVKVAWYDTDNYGHTNYASYMRYAVDAIHAALRGDGKDGATILKGHALKGLNKQIVGNGMKSADICYLKECLEGQKLAVHVWQDESFPCVVKCVIESNSADICHMTLEYFDD